MSKNLPGNLRRATQFYTGAIKIFGLHPIQIGLSMNYLFILNEK